MELTISFRRKCVRVQSRRADECRQHGVHHHVHKNLKAAHLFGGVKLAVNGRARLPVDEDDDGAGSGSYAY